MFILDNPLGISPNISLNSFINGGITKIIIEAATSDIRDITISKEMNLGSFNFFCIWSHKLHTIFEITREHIISRRKSLNVHIINADIDITINLKYKVLFKLENNYFFSEYPKPLVLA